MNFVKICYYLLILRRVHHCQILIITYWDVFYDGERYLKKNKMNVMSERNGTFWLRARTNRDTDYSAEDDQRYQYDRTESLKQLVNLSWTLCEIIHEDYEFIWDDLRELLNLRLARDELDDGGGGLLEDVMSEYEGELYLRRLYITFKNQMMVDTSEEGDVIFSDYIGSRQQCLYGCFYFLVLFISLYDSTDLMNMKNVDWFQGTIIKGGCHSLHLPLASSSMPHSANRLIAILGGGINKTISKCIFDLINTANPSGGLVGPGNSMWFHNVMIKLFGTIGCDYKKLIKNHACIHNACGFLIKHLKIGPGYVYSLFRETS